LVLAAFDGRTRPDREPRGRVVVVVEWCGVAALDEARVPPLAPRALAPWVAELDRAADDPVPPQAAKAAAISTAVDASRSRMPIVTAPHRDTAAASRKRPSPLATPGR